MIHNDRWSTLTYNPSKPPAPQDWSANSLFGEGQAIDEKANNARDFFQRADNKAADIDPRPGYVRLQETPAENLLERNSNNVSGFMTPDGDLWAQAKVGDYNTTSTLTISNNGREVTMDRPVYVNNKYLPTLENLVYNGNGTRTYSSTYLQA